MSEADDYNVVVLRLPKGKPMPLDPNTVKAALDRKGAGGPCSACGKRDWALGDSRYILGNLSDEGAIVVGQGMPAIGMACNNCGNIRLHVPSVLGIQD